MISNFQPVRENGVRSTGIRSPDWLPAFSSSVNVVYAPSVSVMRRDFQLQLVRRGYVLPSDSLPYFITVGVEQSAPAQYPQHTEATLVLESLSRHARHDNDNTPMPHAGKC